jgi:hypothetical protein
VAKISGSWFLTELAVLPLICALLLAIVFALRHVMYAALLGTLQSAMKTCSPADANRGLNSGLSGKQKSGESILAQAHCA